MPFLIKKGSDFIMAKTKNEKITIYLTPELSSKIKDLAHFHRKNVSELFVNLAEEFANKNENSLKIFHDAIKQAEENEQEQDKQAILQ